jgi:MFS family permease
MKSRLIFNFTHSFVFCMAETMFWLTSALKVRDLGGDTFSAGQTGLAYGLANFLTPPLAGVLADRFGRKPTMVLFYLVLIGSCWYMPSVTEFPLFVGTVFLITMGVNGVWPVFEAWLADRARGSLAREMHFYNLGWAAGGATGFLYAGITEQFGTGVSYRTIAIIAAGCLMVRLFMSDPPPHPDGPETAPQEPEEPEEKAQPVATLAAQGEDWEQLGSVWLAQLSVGFCYSLIGWVFPAQAENIGFSAVSVGGLVSIVAWAQLVTFLALSGFIDWYRFVRWRVAFQLVAVGGFALVALGFYLVPGGTSPDPEGLTIPSALFAVAFVGLGIAVATAYAASLVVSLTKAAHRGAKTGIHHSLVGIGSIFAPFLAGYISVEISTSAAYLACIGLIGLALAGQWLLARAARESRAVAGVKGARSDR